MVDTGDGKPVQVVCGAPNARAGLIGAFGATRHLCSGHRRDAGGRQYPRRRKPWHDVLRKRARHVRRATTASSTCLRMRRSVPVRLLCRPRRSGHRDQPDAEPSGLHLDPRHRPRSGRGRSWHAEAACQAALQDRRARPPVKVKIDLDDERLCPGFGLRLVRGVKNGPSPLWMQQRLKAIGLRPINALVDITNYMTFDHGRPMHVFDAAKVKGDLTVRRARRRKGAGARHARIHADAEQRRHRR
jgi:phenylalanyl-tRNA synthetase beta chain